MTYRRAMNDLSDITTRPDMLHKMRGLLAAIVRESCNRNASDMVDPAKTVDEMVAKMPGLETS
jgi:hypothetical protein